MARPRSTLRIQGPVPVGTSGSSRDWGSHRHRLRSAPGGSPLPALGTSAVKRWAVSQEPRNKEGSVEEMTTKRSQAWSAVGPTAIPPLGQTSSVSGPPLNRVTGSASQSAVVCWSLARMRACPSAEPRRRAAATRAHGGGDFARADRLLAASRGRTSAPLGPNRQAPPMGTVRPGLEVVVVAHYRARGWK